MYEQSENADLDLLWSLSDAGTEMAFWQLGGCSIWKQTNGLLHFHYPELWTVGMHRTVAGKRMRETYGCGHDMWQYITYIAWETTRLKTPIFPFLLSCPMERWDLIFAPAYSTFLILTISTDGVMERRVESLQNNICHTLSGIFSSPSSSSSQPSVKWSARGVHFHTSGWPTVKSKGVKLGYNCFLGWLQGRGGGRVAQSKP